ncbi:MAG: monofunctional biosynthetic peptidoglycan transglycosylase [Myxococcota bacterium]
MKAASKPDGQRAKRPPLRRVLGCVSLVARGTLLLSDVVLLLTVLQVASVRTINPPFTATQVSRAWSVGAWPDRQWRSLDALGPVPSAMISAEDQSFWTHSGFDWKAIKDAIAHNREHPESRRGGSTITQQVARNVFLWQGGGYVRKGLEAYYTVLLEALVPKERILELYVNVAETGPDCFGAEAGSKRWFKRSAKDLTAEQASTLAAILPSPRKWTPSDRGVQKRARWIRAHPAPAKKGQ